MEITEKDGKWLARKSKKAKTLEDVTDIIKFDGDFASCMGKAGRTEFHSYLGKIGKKWVEMYGVTSLLNYWGEKENLLQWAVNQACDEVGAFAEACINEEPTGDFDWSVNHWKGQLENIVSHVIPKARSAHKKSLKDAGDHGTDKHALVEEYINNRITKNDHYAVPNEIEDFHKWSFDTMAFIASEMPLRSSKLWVAGTTDFLVEIAGKRLIGDLKTSNYVSFKNFLQCGAYALMYEEMGYGKIDGMVIAHMPRSGGFNVHYEYDVDKYKNLFSSLVQLVKADKDKSYQLYS